MEASAACVGILALLVLGFIPSGAQVDLAKILVGEHAGRVQGDTDPLKLEKAE